MGVRKQNSTAYEHPDEPNLLNVHKAMDYTGDGEPALRVLSNIQGDITITGEVTIPGTISVTSTPEDPVHTHITEVGTSGILDVPYMPIGGTVTVNQPVAVTDNNGSLTVDGTVSLSNATLTALENINATVSGSISVSNFPATQAVTGTFWQATQPVSIATMPTTPVTGTFWQATQPVSGTVTIQDGGNTITVDGTVNANVTFPSIYKISKDTNDNSTSNRIFVDVGTPTISGTVELGTTSLSALENINATVSGTVSIGTDGTVSLSATTLSALENITVSGTVELGTTTLSALETITVNQGTNPWTVNGNVNATITGNSTVTLGTGSTDAFGRLRTSQPYTLFDSRARYYDHNEFSSSTSTGGTVVYDANSSTYQLNVTSANGSSVIRETKRVFPYQPGKSLLVMTTFCMNTPKANLRQRVGYFTTNNGIYFENDGVYNYLVIRSYSSGALVEDKVRQDAWDNPFAGLNVDRTQIFWTDIEWLGVGSVRCGFVINGAYVLCHTFHHANVAGNTTTYMTTAVLPVRYEITNTAGTSGVSMMRQICSTVISEGGYNAFTYSETAGRGTSVLRLVNAGTYYPVVSIRLDSTRLDAIVLPRQVDVLSPTVNYYRWKLVLNPVLTNADWAGTSTSGTVEYDTAATALSGGTELQAGYVSSRELSELGADAFAFQLGRTLAGVSDIVTLAMAATSNNADVLAQIGWQEIT
jgi:hypothetical protein